ncbi:PAS domain-containing protein [Methylobacterium platani]|uniref:PAS fold-3 domain-containing protein n=1 Tax=Methylobacterium platani TaxID=427683 RepID=A0A179SG42_9HYPH|nr:PAS domain-containing protein [Methylobacterium platani]OAS26846.1 hypothetical protein A5481_03810 [Methylobacterium platani]
MAENRLYVDEVAARLFGLDLATAGAGVPIEACEAGLHPEDRPWVSALLRRSAAALGFVETECRTGPPEGDVRRVIVRGRFSHDAEGRPRRGQGLVLDVTDRRDAAGIAAAPVDPDGHVLERAADQCLALRATLATARRPFLLKLADMLLMELGHELAALVRDTRRGRLS